MYSIDAPQRIVTKSLYRTALPFSMLNGIQIGNIFLLFQVARAEEDRKWIVKLFLPSSSGKI
jgi:hypothetical protein